MPRVRNPRESFSPSGSDESETEAEVNLMKEGSVEIATDEVQRLEWSL